MGRREREKHVAAQVDIPLPAPDARTDSASTDEHVAAQVDIPQPAPDARTDPASTDEHVAAQVDIPLPALFFDARTGMADPVSTDDDMHPWPANRPLVSVVIPSFNYGHFVAEAVDSVLAQTLSNLEVIVIEGGSTDADSRRLTLALKRPRTCVIAQDTSHLVGANRNFGISRARGKYICCLDADDMLAPTYLEKAIFLMESYGYDVLSCGLQFFGDRHGRYNLMESPTLADIVEVNQIHTAAVFRRRLWREVGGYRDSDRELTGYVFEDWMFNGQVRRRAAPGCTKHVAGSPVSLSLAWTEPEQPGIRRPCHGCPRRFDPTGLGGPDWT